MVEKDDKKPTLEDLMAQMKAMQAEHAETKKALEAKDAAAEDLKAELDLLREQNEKNERALASARKAADEQLKAAAKKTSGTRDEKVAELEAALAAKDVELEAAKASIPGMTEVSRQRQVAQNNEQRNKLRAKLMAKTFHKNGRAFYNSGDQPANVGGHYIEAKTTFAVPEDHIPSVLWLPVDHKGRVLGEDEEAEFLDTSAPTPGTTRAADRP